MIFCFELFFFASPLRFTAWLPKDDLQDGPHGHRPRFCCSVTSTPSFAPNTALRRDVRCLSHTHGLVVDSAPRTVSLISRRTLLSPFRSSTASMTPVCGVRTLPTLLLLKSRHRIGSPLRVPRRLTTGRLARSLTSFAQSENATGG